MIQLTDLVPLIQTITTMRSRTATIYMEYIYLKSLTTFSYGWRRKEPRCIKNRGEWASKEEYEEKFSSDT